MRDSNRIQKLLNLTSSSNDAEALAALRMAQKLLGDGEEANLGDLLAQREGGLQRYVSEALYNELEDLFELEVAKAEVLRKALGDKDKTLRKQQRDIMNLKREAERAESRLAAAGETIAELTEELLRIKASRS